MPLWVFVDATLTMMSVRKELGWDYSQTLEEGIRKTYDWINLQLKNKNYIPFHHPV
jgi:dTDP-D-glucose 4,6-dehydratase